MLSRTVKRAIRGAIEIIGLPFLVIAALLSRFVKRPVQVGLGPVPLINNIYHKKALRSYGYSAESFVDSLYFITNNFDQILIPRSWIGRRLQREFYLVFLFSIRRYQCLYIYFNGGPLYATVLLWRFEPLLYRLAKVRIVVMPYGGDVQALNRTPNLLFRHVMAQDYPLQRHTRGIIEKRIDIWLSNANHVISGCDWVDYMHFWHTLMVAHFSIDLDLWTSASDVAASPGSSRPFRILHAPNHRAIKGTRHFVKAVEELRAEGLSIELILIEKQPNDRIREIMDSVDIVADQLVIGWYAMFAIEAMAMGKPVLCYLRADLERLYVDAGVIEEGEIPIINCEPCTVKDVIRRLVLDRDQVNEMGRRGPAYVRRRHSTDAVGAVFDRINRLIGLVPLGPTQKDLS